MQRRGHSLGTFGHLRRPSGILGNHRKHSVNPRQPSETVGNLHCDRFFTRFRHQIGQIWSYRGIHTTNRCEISRSIDSEGGQRLVFDIWWWKIEFPSVFWSDFWRKKEVFVTKSVRKRFYELSLGRNDRLGLGTSKIEVLAKNTKKNLGKSMIFLVFPACGVGFLTSSSTRNRSHYVLITSTLS